MIGKEIRHDANKFYKVINKLESHLNYELINDTTVVFYHTYVPDELRGRAIAKNLIKEGLDWAISQNLEIIATCSAVQRFIARNTIYRDYINNFDRLYLEVQMNR